MLKDDVLIDTDFLIIRNPLDEIDCRENEGTYHKQFSSRITMFSVLWLLRFSCGFFFQLSSVIYPDY